MGEYWDDAELQCFLPQQIIWRQILLLISIEVSHYSLASKAGKEWIGKWETKREKESRAGADACMPRCGSGWDDTHALCHTLLWPQAPHPDSISPSKSAFLCTETHPPARTWIRTARETSLSFWCGSGGTKKPLMTPARSRVSFSPNGVLFL